MSISHLKKEIARIKDMAVDNFDNHFNEYISIDLQETGDEDYFLVDSVNPSLKHTKKARIGSRTYEYRKAI